MLIDGEPALRPIPGAALERVINTPALLVHDKANAKYYLAGDGQWFAAGSIQGPWSLAQSPPAEVAALSPAPTNGPVVRDEGPAPRIIVSTSPAELLMTSGLPDFRPIRGTALQYAADTDSQLFFHTTDREAYLLISGRWFKAKSLGGPWNHVAPRDLPPDFAKIPPGSAQAVVLASVPDTPQAELAVVANSIPTTATVSRRDARIQLSYDGEPKFQPIEGTRHELRRQRATARDPNRGPLLCGGRRRVVRGRLGHRPLGAGDRSAGGDLHHPAQLAGLLRDVCPGVPGDGRRSRSRLHARLPGRLRG